MKFIKKSLFSLLLLSSVFTVESQIPTDFINQAYTTNEEKTVYYGQTYVEMAQKKVGVTVVWDLNNVVFTQKFNAWYIIRAARKEMGSTLGGLRELRKLSALKNKVNDERKLHNLPPCQWEHIMYILMRLDNEEAKQSVKFLQSLMEKPDTIHRGVAHLIYDLNECGCQQGVLSNMWQENLELQINHLKTQGEEYKHIVQLLENENLRVTPTVANNWVHKTEREAYQMSLKKIRKNAPDVVTIFVDDNPENVREAVKYGYDIGVVFRGSSKELRKILVALGVPLKTKERREEVIAAA